MDSIFCLSTACSCNTQSDIRKHRSLQYSMIGCCKLRGGLGLGLSLVVSLEQVNSNGKRTRLKVGRVHMLTLVRE